MSEAKVTLKAGREKSVLNRHPWIFSGAVEGMSDFPDGAIASVYSHDQVKLGQAYINRRSSIIGRILSFGAEAAMDAIERHIDGALALRTRYLRDTNAFRMINGEADSLPGLVVDRYGEVLVMQSGTLGMDLLKPEIASLLVKKLSPRSIYEKSVSGSRKEEGLSTVEGVVHGEKVESIEIFEENLKYTVRFQDAQKTGFYLDQRGTRTLVAQYAKGRTVLNCFSYTGGFSVNALHAGAQMVTSVDSSAEAIKGCADNIKLNRLPTAQHKEVVGDVLPFLRQCSAQHDFIILDPPAFAKKEAHVESACRGYNEINRIALTKLPPGGLLLTCSCSAFIPEMLFRKIIFQASREAQREVRIIERHRYAIDHPVSVFHPESDYLKSFLLYVE